MKERWRASHISNGGAVVSPLIPNQSYDGKVDIITSKNEKGKKIYYRPHVVFFLVIIGIAVIGLFQVFFDYIDLEKWLYTKDIIVRENQLNKTTNLNIKNKIQTVAFSPDTYVNKEIKTKELVEVDLNNNTGVLRGKYEINGKQRNEKLSNIEKIRKSLSENVVDEYNSLEFDESSTSKVYRKKNTDLNEKKLEEKDNNLKLSKRFIPQKQLFPKIPKSFAYFKGSCNHYCRSMVKAGYRLLPGLTSPAAPEFLIISYKSVNKYANLKTSIVNQVGYGSSCIGGGKGKQLLCKEEFTKSNGCAYSSLKIQPEQWNLKAPSECKRFFEYASQPSMENQIWIVKPGGAFHGAGIKLYNGIEKLKNKYRCLEFLNDGVIAQKYIAKPALFSGHKFDFRSFMLIVSMDPYIVFYHDGFIRKSEHKYSTDTSDLKDPLAHITNSRGQSSDNHFFNFQQLQDVLTKESKFDPSFIDKIARPHMKRVTQFMFHAAKQKFKHRAVRFQLFALDWMLDMKGDLHLLEANGNPQTTFYPGIKIAPAIWTTMMDLVHLVQVEPEALPEEFSVQDKYQFEGWSMIYNELEEIESGELYNPCKFHQYIKDKHPIFS